MIEIRTGNDLKHARSQPTAIIFIWVAWAIQAQLSAQLLESLAQHCETDRKLQAIKFYRLNLSEQSGELWDATRLWLSDQSASNADALMFGGNGAIIWARSGAIVASVPHVADCPIEELLAFTANAIG